MYIRRAKILWNCVENGSERYLRRYVRLQSALGRITQIPISKILETQPRPQSALSPHLRIRSSICDWVSWADRPFDGAENPEQLWPLLQLGERARGGEDTIHSVHAKNATNLCNGVQWPSYCHLLTLSKVP